MASPPKRPRDEHSLSPTNKRSKSSPEDKAARLAEKDAKRIEREEKKREKDQAKAKELAEKEEKKRIKEEAKARELLERSKELAEKEEKRRLKEEVRAKELAEKEKKDRMQLKMGNFFKKAEPPKPMPVLAKEQSSVFMPFSLKEHTRLGKFGKSSKPQDAVSFEEHLRSGADQSPPDIRATLQTAKRREWRKVCGEGRRRVTLRERLLEVSNVPIEERFKDISYKLIQFHSDVRPAYFGTMTTTPAARGLLTGRFPHAKTIELNYDYDSEADWIEGDDDDAGEELGDDDDMSVTSKDTYGGESDDFVDDDEDTGTKHNLGVKGTLIPSLLGIFSADDCAPVEQMRLQTLIDTKLPIDPLKDYWNPAPVLAEIIKNTTNTIKLHPSLPASAILVRKTTTTNSPQSASFPEKYLPAFKKAIQGSNLTKINLVEKLRLEFKQYKVSKKAIEDMLNEIAQRQGRGQHDVWTLK